MSILIVALISSLRGGKSRASRENDKEKFFKGLVEKNNNKKLHIENCYPHFVG
jgi:hypothetical protein